MRKPRLDKGIEETAIAVAAEAEQQAFELTLRKFDVKWTGFSPLMFQRFIGQIKDQDPETMLYLDDKRELFVPAANVYSFFCNGDNGKGCAMTFEARAHKMEMLRLAKAYLAVRPNRIPILREGKPIAYGKFDERGDKKSGLIIDERAAVGKGARTTSREMRRRPVLDLPWEVTFQLILVMARSNQALNGQKLLEWMQQGGMEIGILAHRPMFGKFTVEMRELPE